MAIGFEDSDIRVETGFPNRMPKYQESNLNDSCLVVWLTIAL